LFYASGLEKICMNISAMVVDAAVDPNQPGAKHWSSAQPDAAIADFVTLVLGLTASDPRTARAQAALTAHFGNSVAHFSPTDALRSTFVTACLAPSFIGIGM
jgi:hypothetical protein